MESSWQLWELEMQNRIGQHQLQLLCLAVESRRDCESIAKRLDTGVQKVFSHSGTQVHNAEGKVVLALITYHDITERKRAEEALRESEERFRVALHGSPVVVFSQDRELRYTWVYNAAPGFKAEEVVGKREEEIDAEGPG